MKVIGVWLKVIGEMGGWSDFGSVDFFCEKMGGKLAEALWSHFTVLVVASRFEVRNVVKKSN